METTSILEFRKLVLPSWSGFLGFCPTRF